MLKLEPSKQVLVPACPPVNALQQSLNAVDCPVNAVDCPVNAVDCLVNAVQCPVTQEEAKRTGNSREMAVPR